MFTCVEKLVSYVTLWKRVKVKPWRVWHSSLPGGQPEGKQNQWLQGYKVQRHPNVTQSALTTGIERVLVQATRDLHDWAKRRRSWPLEKVQLLCCLRVLKSPRQSSPGLLFYIGPCDPLTVSCRLSPFITTNYMWKGRPSQRVTSPSHLCRKHVHTCIHLIYACCCVNRSVLQFINPLMQNALMVKEVLILTLRAFWG